MNIEDDDIAANAEKAFFSPSVTLLQRIERWVKYFEGIFIIIVFLVLSGWQFDIEFLKRPFLHTATMSLVMAFAIFPRYFLLLFISENR